MIEIENDVSAQILLQVIGPGHAGPEGVVLVQGTDGFDKQSIHLLLLGVTDRSGPAGNIKGVAEDRR